MNSSDEVSVVSTAVETVGPARGPHFVISIDYGTTFTGAAWWLTSTANPVPTRDNDINVVRHWPIKIDDKVPSAITYSANGGHNWGFGIGSQAYVIRWTKLELEPPKPVDALRTLKRTLNEAQLLRFTPEEAIAGTRIPRHLIKSPYDILVDYMKEVATSVVRDIRNKNRGEDLSRFPIDFMITHPAEWHDHAKGLTFKAVNEAFDHVIPPSRRSTRPGYIRMVSEPEACAKYTVHARGDGIRDLERGDCFVMVDAGGGTVDLVSFMVEQVEPSFNISMITRPAGRKCGATTVDRYFLDVILPERLGSDDYNKLMGSDQGQGRGTHRGILSQGEQFVLEAFETIKHRFTGQETGNIVGRIDLPDGVGERNNPAANLSGGQLSITKDDMIAMFRESVEGTVRLINGQLTLIDQTRRQMRLRVRTVFLCGGLSRNQYLYNVIQERMAGWRLNIVRGEDSWTAVARGATLIGLGVRGSPPKPSVPCPFNIGIVTSERYASWKHGSDQRCSSFDGLGPRANKNIHWMVYKGDLIDPAQPLIKKLTIVHKYKHEGKESGRLTVITERESWYPEKRYPVHGGSEHHLDYDLKTLPAEIKTAAFQRVNVGGQHAGEEHTMVNLQVDVNVNQKQAQLDLICGRTFDFLGNPGSQGKLLCAPLQLPLY